MKKFKELAKYSCLLVLIGLLLNPKTSMSKDLSVAIEHWPPFIFADSKPYRGIDIDLLKEIASRLGWNLKLRKLPWARTLEMLKSGDVDAVISIAKTKEREAYLCYTSPPYVKLSTVFYVPKGKADLIQTYEDLYKLKIGIVRGSSYFKRFDKDHKIIKYPVAREIQLIKMLVRNRFDAFIGTDAQADYQIAQSGHKGLFEKAKYKPGNEVFLYIGISKESPFVKKVNQLNKAIQQIKEEGKIYKFMKKYLK